MCHPVEASDAAQQCWKSPPGGGGGGLQLGATPWSPTDCGQQDSSTQPMAYSATPALAADVYMQTLCPSYTMLTYTHTPLLTNFGVRVQFQTAGRDADPVIKRPTTPGSLIIGLLHCKSRRWRLVVATVR